MSQDNLQALADMIAEVACLSTNSVVIQELVVATSRKGEPIGVIRWDELNGYCFYPSHSDPTFSQPPGPSR